MTAVNHAAAGAAIALAVNKPILAIPLAFLSHFAMDALPHFGYAGRGGFEEALKHKLSSVVVGLDIIGWVFLLWVAWGLNWLVYVSAFVAVSPDLAWPYRYYLFERKGRKPPKKDIISEWHSRMQWCERPWGLPIEIAVAVILITLVAKLR